MTDITGGIITRGFDDQISSSRFAIVLERYEHLPAIFAFCKLVKAPIDFGSASALARPESSSTFDEKNSSLAPAENVVAPHRTTPIYVDALRLIELSQRPSALIKASESEETLKAADSLNQIFRAYAAGVGIPTTCALSMAAYDSFSSIVAGHAAEKRADMIMLPWSLSNGRAEEGVAASYLPNPFESMFKSGSSSREGSPQYATFVRRVFAEGDLYYFLFSMIGNLS